MTGSLDIREVTGRIVMDLKAGPSVEVEVALENGARARATVPLREEGDAKEELTAIRDWYSEQILYKDVTEQENIDALLLKNFDNRFQNGSGRKGRLAVSMAVIRAAGAGIGLPLYRYMGGSSVPKIPVPIISLIGGESLEKGTDFQETMIVLQGNIKYSEKLRMGTQIHYNVEKLLKGKDYRGMAEEGMNCLMQAISLAGYKLGKDIQLALITDADWLYVKEEGRVKIINMERAGTVSEVLFQVREARKAGQKIMIESDLNDTEEDFISDFATAVRADYIKIETSFKSEWTAKNNEIIRLEELYNDKNMKTGCI